MNSTVSEINISYKPTFLYPDRRLTSAEQIAHLLRELFDTTQLTVREECIALFLNRNNKLTGWYKVSSGGITGTVVDIRLILSIALKSISCSLVLAHTHPSGSLQPSQCDINMTHRLKEGAKLLDINLLDHFILTTDDFYSFAEHGYI